MSSLRVTIPGCPVAAGRPRAVSMGGHARVYMPNRSASWQATAAEVIRHAAAMAGVRWLESVPLSVTVMAYWPRPASWPKTKRLEQEPRPSKPDCDNVAKAALDACTLAGIWHDDAQVTGLCVTKWTCAAGSSPRVEVFIEDES